MGKPGEYRGRLLKKFRESGAVGDGNEKTIAALGVSDEYSVKMLDALVRRGVVISKGDKYFLSEKYKYPFLKRLFVKQK